MKTTAKLKLFITTLVIALLGAVFPTPTHAQYRYYDQANNPVMCWLTVTNQGGPFVTTVSYDVPGITPPTNYFVCHVKKGETIRAQFAAPRGSTVKFWLDSKTFIQLAPGSDGNYSFTIY